MLCAVTKPMRAQSQRNAPSSPMRRRRPRPTCCKQCATGSKAILRSAQRKAKALRHGDTRRIPRIAANLDMRERPNAPRELHERTRRLGSDPASRRIRAKPVADLGAITVRERRSPRGVAREQVDFAEEDVVGR